MIAARYIPGVGLKVDEAPVPSINEDELLVRVGATSICGTDLKIVSCGHRKLRPGQSIILGHEFAGTVEQAGKEVTGFVAGTRVGVAPNMGCGLCEMCGRGLMNMCQNYSAFGIDRDGSHAEYVRIPARAISQGNVIPLSPNVGMIEAALAEPLSCVVNGMRAVRLEVGESVLIYGAGPMGLLNLMLAVASGASKVYVVEPNEARLDKARQLGATEVLNPVRSSVPDRVRDLTGGRGVDVVVVATPISRLQQEAIELLAPLGRLCLFASLPNGKSMVPLDTNAIHYKNLIVTGMTGGAPRDYRTALSLIESGRLDVRKVVSHVFPLREAERAYATAQSSAGLKIVMTNQNGPVQ